MQRGHGIERWTWLIALLCAGCSVLLLLADPRLLQTLRNNLFDQYQRWQPRSYTPAPVRIIDIDEESLRRHGQWPWPRTRVAELTSRLQQAGAAAVVFDMVFAEPDRSSPRSLVDLWQPPETLARALLQLPDHDQVLADTLAAGTVVLGFALHHETDVQARPLGEIKPRYTTLGEAPQPFVGAFGSAVGALPVLAGAAAGQGAITFVPDSDGVVRRAPLLLRQGNRLLPGLSAEALRVAQGALNYVTRTSPGRGVGLQEIRIGQLTIPTTAQGEAWVHYTGPVPQRVLAAWKVLGAAADPAQLRGSIVLVGTSAQGLMDMRFSPLGGTIPGVEIHAQLIEQVLLGQHLQRPAWALSLEAVIVAVGGALIGWIVLRRRALVGAAACAGLLALLWTAAWLAFSRHGLLLDALLPGSALLATFILTGTVRHIATERQQRWIRQAFSRYISPNRVAHLIANPQTLALGGQRRQCSFVFTDLAGFTKLMETLDPALAVELLNAYLDRMIAIAFEHQGTLERIMGDAVAILFSAPVTQQDHQQRALDCALAMHRFCQSYLIDTQARGLKFCSTRIGVHSGEVIVGNFGGKTLFDYRALGDPINTASRLEGANKYLGTLICVSEATLAGCTGALVRPVGRLLLQGKTQALMVYEPLDPRTHTQPDLDYNAALARMHKNPADGLQAFEALAALRANDPLVALHLQRLRAGHQDDLIVMGGK